MTSSDICHHLSTTFFTFLYWSPANVERARIKFAVSNVPRNGSQGRSPSSGVKTLNKRQTPNNIGSLNTSHPPSTLCFKNINYHWHLSVDLECCPKHPEVAQGRHGSPSLQQAAYQWGIVSIFLRYQPLSADQVKWSAVSCLPGLPHLYRISLRFLAPFSRLRHSRTSCWCGVAIDPDMSSSKNFLKWTFLTFPIEMIWFFFSTWWHDCNMIRLSSHW